MLTLKQMLKEVNKLVSEPIDDNYVWVMMHKAQDMWNARCGLCGRKFKGWHGRRIHEGKAHLKTGRIINRAVEQILTKNKND